MNQVQRTAVSRVRGNGLFSCVLVLLIGLLSARGLAAQEGQADIAFLQGTQVKRLQSANDLAWESRFRELVNTDLGKLKGKQLGRQQPLADVVLEVLSGPAEPMQRQGEWLVASACRQHSCDEKGLFAVDTKTGVRGYGVIGYFHGSGHYSHDRPVLSLLYPARTPANFRQRFEMLARLWLRDKTSVEEPVEVLLVQVSERRD